MGKKNLKDNPPSPTSPIAPKRKQLAGTCKNTRGKRPLTVVEFSDSDFELETKFVKSPKSVKGKGKFPVKILPSTGVVEEIIDNRVVEVLLFVGWSLGKAVSIEEIDVVDSGRFNEFGWGKHFFDMTIQSLKGKIDSGLRKVVRSDEDGGYYRLLGFPLAIQFWFFKCYPYVIGKLSLYSNVGIPRLLNWPKLPKDKDGQMKMDVMNSLVFNRSLKELKLRNISPTSVERVSLKLDDFFSGDTTPNVVKFKVKGVSKSVGEPDLMGASSSSAHENVSRLEYEELKKNISVVVSQQGILMKSFGEMNKKLDILIESSHAGHTHTRTQSDDALRTSENDDDDDLDLDEVGVGVGQDEAAIRNDRNDEGVVVAEVVSKDDDTGKVDSSSKDANIADANIVVGQSEQHQVDDEKIDVDATIASAVNVVEKLIVSSNIVSGSAEISEKNVLDYVLPGSRFTTMYVV
ncbi:hypothetical protein CsatB_007560 [Cannabis sativa]